MNHTISAFGRKLVERTRTRLGSDIGKGLVVSGAVVGTFKGVEIMHERNEEPHMAFVCTAAGTIAGAALSGATAAFPIATPILLYTFEKREDWFKSEITAQYESSAL
jgi:hypothetical protein